MYQFSLVVPLLGDPSLFEDTLASVLRYRSESCQVIVAHDESYEDPHGLAAEGVEFVSTKRKAHLIRLFNCGLRAAKGAFIGLIQPGIQLDENWDAPIANAFENPDVGSVAPAIVSSSNPTRLVTAGVTSSYSGSRRLEGVDKRINSRRISKAQPLGPTSWAAFYRRSLMISLGSCDEQLDPHFLDLDLALSLQNLQFGCQFCPECVVLVDDPSCITNEIRLPHGKSAQRSLVRQQELSTSQKITRMTLATLAEIALVPLRPSNLKHAIQRFGAVRMGDIDRHHWALISILNQQRRRLVTTSLLMHEASQSSLARTTGVEKQPSKTSCSG